MSDRAASTFEISEEVSNRLSTPMTTIASRPTATTISTRVKPLEVFGVIVPTPES
jgi:hypothetical protein